MKIASSFRLGISFALGGVLLLPVAEKTFSAPLPFAEIAPAPDDETLTLNSVYRAKAEDVYALTLKLDVPNPADGKTVPVTIKMRFREKVKEVKPDGSAVLVGEFEEARFLQGEVEAIKATKDELPRIERTLDKHGHLLGVKSEGGVGIMARFGNTVRVLHEIQATLFPSKPVKIGEEWNVEHAFADTPKDRGLKITGKSRLEKKETVENHETWLVKAASDIAGKGANKEEIKVRFEGTGNLDATTGHVVKLSGKLDGNLGGGGKTKAELTYSLLPEEPKADKEKPKEKSVNEKEKTKKDAKS